MPSSVNSSKPIFEADFGFRYQLNWRISLFLLIALGTSIPLSLSVFISPIIGFLLIIQVLEAVFRANLCRIVGETPQNQQTIAIIRIGLIKTSTHIFPRNDFRMDLQPLKKRWYYILGAFIMVYLSFFLLSWAIELFWARVWGYGLLALVSGLSIFIGIGIGLITPHHQIWFTALQSFESNENQLNSEKQRPPPLKIFWNLPLRSLGNELLLIQQHLNPSLLGMGDDFPAQVQQNSLHLIITAIKQHPSGLGPMFLIILSLILEFLKIILLPFFSFMIFALGVISVFILFSPHIIQMYSRALVVLILIPVLIMGLELGFSIGSVLWISKSGFSVEFSLSSIWSIIFTMGGVLVFRMICKEYGIPLLIQNLSHTQGNVSFSLSKWRQVFSRVISPMGLILMVFMGLFIVPLTFSAMCIKPTVLINNQATRLRGTQIFLNNKMDVDNVIGSLKRANINAIRTLPLDNATIFAKFENAEIWVILDIGGSWSDAKTVEQVVKLVNYYKNYTNIIAWVLGNEEFNLNLSVPYDHVKAIRDAVKAIDNRPVIYASSMIVQNPLFSALQFIKPFGFTDWTGYNVYSFLHGMQWIDLVNVYVQPQREVIGNIPLVGPTFLGIMDVYNIVYTRSDFTRLPYHRLSYDILGLFLESFADYAAMQNTPLILTEYASPRPEDMPRIDQTELMTKLYLPTAKLYAHRMAGMFFFTWNYIDTDLDGVPDNNVLYDSMQEFYTAF